MAAVIKGLNARIRSNPVTDYVCSTHFWGPVSNFGIPFAAVMDTQKEADIISGRMTLALSGYSAVFMRYALAVTPKNWLLFGCHIVNFSAQSVQGYRFVDYWYMGGREKTLQRKEEAARGVIGKEASNLAQEAKQGLQKAESKIEKGIDRVKGQ